MPKIKLGGGDDILPSPSKRARDNKKAMLKIRDEVVTPYYKALHERGLDAIKTETFRKTLFGKIRKIVRIYRNRLSLKDILAIMITALDDPYFVQNGSQTNLDMIFIYNKTLVVKYLTKGVKNENDYFLPNNCYFVVDAKGNVLDPIQYGYFEKEGDDYFHIPPEDIENSIYGKINKEISNRIEGKSDKKYDKYFKNGMLKSEYGYLSGNPGINNKFVKEY